jgi:hypothetical protein
MDSKEGQLCCFLASPAANASWWSSFDEGAASIEDIIALLLVILSPHSSSLWSLFPAVFAAIPY